METVESSEVDADPDDATGASLTEETEMLNVATLEFNDPSFAR